ncbi:dihydroorotate dehydrogenase [Orbilia oligospora]|uniref:Dihydroorotate dehydrogenase (fumarate) n=1 Tax=Orbilia oligospora TaxID=2813651 RepID=A0A7C8NAH3_ORBOL|nr:dihydroorotate dehydrogenase [Orbilia oligospora]KAF3102901.1 dihydroorotate dehydrogenase [Orbilia oligospora]KAF3113048.1 dihydroorotate dehydrogenase [Orbilia oligospora]KAF3121132.1 dihydroorotate dehydrogenase [Orbilia oligospora]KAF3127009.1 dihydroorotate dehydrogenase [Orbilia oligospora]
MTSQITISPPLLNTSTPWATTLSDLQAIYDSESTGAVTTRTSFPVTGFQDDPSIHQHAFLPNASSLNTYGYSPHPLSYYLTSIESIITSSDLPQSKPFIISITGTSVEVTSSVSTISKWAHEKRFKVYAEINLSCPNIPNKPPPAYSSAGLKPYLQGLSDLQQSLDVTMVAVGIKTPPYTYQNQFDELISAVEEFPGILSFITATNTLGNSLFYEFDLPTTNEGELTPIIASASGTGVGGLAGESIHPLSLGNVFTIRNMLDRSIHEDVRDIIVIGAGGVGDQAGYKRMRKAGAAAVGVGTAFGREGVEVFGKIHSAGVELI